MRLLLPHGVALALVACGGQSLTNGQGSQGGAGGVAASGAVGARGGDAGAGAAAGSGGLGIAGSAQVGGSSGNGGTGGSVGIGGNGALAGRGGSASGGAGTGGMGALAGQAGATSDVCSLPLEAGPCDAAINRYGFNPATQRCEPFTYGGCEGNQNSFETFEACVMACGLANETGCPNSMPIADTACSGPKQPCDYMGTTNCLCQPHSQSLCEEIAPSCNIAGDWVPPPSGAAGACSDPGCIEAVLVISYFTCTCDSTWSCHIGGQTGGLR